MLLQETEAPAQINQSLVHGVEILMHLAASMEPIGGRELARTLGMEPTHVNRILGTFAHMGMAIRTQNRKYISGNGIHILAALSLRGNPLFRVAQPHLTELVRDTGKSVALGVLWGQQVCYLFYGHDETTLAPGVSNKNLYPAEKSSIGRVLLAAKPDNMLRKLYANTPAFLRELMEIRLSGYAVGDTGSIAVLIPDAGAGLALHGHFGKPMQPEEQTARLHQTADAIRNDLKKIRG